MRTKVTLVLVFLNVALFFYIFHFEAKWRQDRAGLVNSRKVYGPEAATIDSITRSAPNSPTVRLEKRGDTWWLTQPYEWPANPNAVESILRELQFLEHDTSFAVKDLAAGGQGLADYGLDQPSLTFAFTSAGRSFETKLGNPTTLAARLYLLTPGAERVHVVNRAVADSLGLALDQLRSDSVFTIPIFEARSLGVQAGAAKTRLRRDGARWAFETPILARADKDNVNLALNALTNLQGRNFLETNNADLDRAGLKNPVLSVTIEGNARRETLLLGAHTGDDYFAKIEDKSAVFTVTAPSALLTVLRGAQEALRDRRILDLGAAAVTTLSISAPDRPPVALQRLDAPDNENNYAWQMAGRAIDAQTPAPLAAEAPLVQEILRQLSDLRATRFVSDAPAAAELESLGFNRPERTVVLHTGAGAPLTLEFGVSPDQPGKAFARVTNAPALLEVDPVILDVLPANPLHYRQRLLRALPSGASITGLALTETGAANPLFQRQLAEGETWDTALAAEPEARRTAVRALLAESARLAARSFSAQVFNPAQVEVRGAPAPWKYQLTLNLALQGGGAVQNEQFTLLLSERLGGTSQLAGTAEFGGVVFEVSQALLDALFQFTFTEKTDPGPPPAPKG
jgi:hypothetical protein